MNVLNVRCVVRSFVKNVHSMINSHIPTLNAGCGDAGDAGGAGDGGRRCSIRLNFNK